MVRKKVTFKKAIKKFRKADFSVIFTTVMAKCLFGVGLGMLLIPYLGIQNPIKIGWIIIIISLLLHGPMVYEILCKK